MTERVMRLREQSLNATETITAERAQLITRFYSSREAQGLSAPVLRARAFEYLLRNKSICISEGELIVGERGPAPKATPTYPEISLHSVKDLEILDSREKVYFKVSEEVKKIYSEEIIPYWKGRSNRDRIMERMTPEWLAAYKAGIFTEFQEQRAPGHTVLGYKMFRTGFLDLKKEVAAAVAALDFRNDPQAYERGEELKAMDIACDAIIMYAGRHAEKLESMATAEKDPARKDELQKMAAVCRRVPAHAPESFHEMLQHYWFIHLGVVTELNPWDSFNPGRLDQHLWPVYKKEVEEGTLSKDAAYELLG
ncbi:formate C-acetyltransferase/glycerol dehydratase family glycyl radical enzyme, partial [bacterium]|nr:formate C-acetyltransferase/glycerol dehydratase family glycyl radical enzyme [bacterium]